MHTHLSTHYQNPSMPGGAAKPSMLWSDELAHARFFFTWAQGAICIDTMHLSYSYQLHARRFPHRPNVARRRIVPPLRQAIFQSCEVLEKLFFILFYDYFSKTMISYFFINF